MESYVFFFFAIIVSIHAATIQESNDEKHGHFRTKVKHYTNKRCTLEQQLELEEDFDKIDLCIDKLLPNHTIDDEQGLEEKCFYHRKQSIKCVENMIDTLRICIPPDEQFLEDFFLEGYKEFSKYLCEHIHVLTLEGLLESNMIECLNIFDREDQHNPHGICFDGWKTLDPDYTPAINKEIYCEDLDGVYECFKRKFKEVCPDAHKAWEFEAGLIDGFRSPCTKWRKEQKQNAEE